MADTPDTALAPAMRAILRERVVKQQAQKRAEGKQARDDQRLVEKASDPTSVGVTLPEDVARMGFLTRRTYLGVLNEPAVVESIRDKLTKGTAREVTAMVQTLVTLLGADGVGAPPSAGAMSITVKNLIPRPLGSPSIDITPTKGEEA